MIQLFKRRKLPECVGAPVESNNDTGTVHEFLSKHPYRAAKRIQTLYWSLVAVTSVFIITLQPVYAADNFWDAFSAIMKDIYGKLLGISTIVAVTAATVALLIRMISRNQRAVDEASSWLKRILVTWIILNTLGFIISYLQPLIKGGQYTP